MKTPTMPTSSTRNAAMYSPIRSLITLVEYRTEMKVRSVVSTTSSTESPSTASS